MRRPGASLVVLATLLLVSVGHADVDKVSYFVVSELRPKPIDSTREGQIKDGMTLKQVVATLGPGWMSPNEGVGFIQWFFNDGNALVIKPRWNDDEVVTYTGQSGTTRMRWVR